jgi:YD repeat-containing protein
MERQWGRDFLPKIDRNSRKGTLAFRLVFCESPDGVKRFRAHPFSRCWPLLLWTFLVFYYACQSLASLTQPPAGHATSYERDAQGNLLRQTTTRTKSGAGVPPVIETLTVQFQYDAQSRLTNSIFPDGSTASTIYNTIGKPAVTIDQQGRQTVTEYDELGRVTRTIYPDGNSDSSGYES